MVQMSNKNITNKRYFIAHLSITMDKEGYNMDAIKRIDQLMKERNWTKYKLAAESGLSSSTIANIYRRNTIPSIATLEAICAAFGISLSQFFADENSNVLQLSNEQLEFFNKWVTLTNEQKELLYILIQEFR